MSEEKDKRLEDEVGERREEQESYLSRSTQEEDDNDVYYNNDVYLDDHLNESKKNESTTRLMSWSIIDVNYERSKCTPPSPKYLALYRLTRRKLEEFEREKELLDRRTDKSFDAGKTSHSSCGSSSLDHKSTSGTTCKTMQKSTVEIGGSSCNNEPKINNSRSVPQPEDLPVEFKDYIQSITDGVQVNPVLVVERVLYATDLNPHHGRLSFPIKQVKNEFLNEEEKARLKRKETIEAYLIDTLLTTHRINFKKYEMSKSGNYILQKPWNEIQQQNKFIKEKIIQVWSFHKNQDLWFVLVRKD